LIRRGAINGGADWLESFEVTEVIRERGYAKGVKGIYGGKPIEIRSDAVVLADGGHSILGRPFGFFNDDPQTIFVGARGYFDGVEGLVQGLVEEHYPAEIFYPGGYMWLFPMGGKKANVGIYIREANLRKGTMRLEEYFDWWRDNTKIGKARLGNAKLVSEIKGWRLPTCRKVGEYYDNGILAVGDAASHINTYSGGGFDYAMKGAQVAAQTLAEALEKGDLSKEALSIYKERDEELNNGLFILNSAVSDKICCDPETYMRFTKYAQTIDGYPDINQYKAYVWFMLMELEVDMLEEYGLDLSSLMPKSGDEESVSH
jgi:digeranylgeranylglycerophospholipid reductase